MKKIFLLSLCITGYFGCAKEKHSSCSDLLNKIAYDFSKSYVTAKKQEFFLDNKPISNKLILRNDRNQFIKLDDLVKEGPILVFRYSNINCSSCIENILSELKGLETNNVIIIGTYSNIRSFSAFTRANNSRHPCYFLDSSENSLERSCFATELNPYIFILDYEKKIKYPMVLLENVENEIKVYNDLLSKNDKK